MTFDTLSPNESIDRLIWKGVVDFDDEPLTSVQRLMFKFLKEAVASEATRSQLHSRLVKLFFAS